MVESARAGTRGESRRSKLRILLCLCLLMLLPAEVAAAAVAAPLFEDDTVLNVRLSGPLGTLIEHPESREARAFVLSANGVDHAIMVRVRGRSRLDVCQFLPLQFEFGGEGTANTVFEGQQRLKLVTHCRTSASYETSVLREYAAYRIFNLISEVGYKVRLLHITYHDTDGRLEDTTFQRYGFLIEPAAALADRTDGQVAEVGGVSLALLDKPQAAAVFIFQFLIGNTDWSLVPSEGESCCCHNIDLVDIGSRRYSVPFDFDLSGLVNARYARPHPKLRISRVTQRRYRGYCIDPEALAGALTRITMLRADILDVINGLPGLSPEARTISLAYLERFFARAEDEDKLLFSFGRSCLR